MNKSLFLRLVAPLAVLASASLWASRKWPADGFFINLATELVGIVLTVVYVDWILKKHEEERWRGAAARIENRLQLLCNGAISGLRSALGFSSEILDSTAMSSGSFKAMSAENMRVGTQVLSPAVRNRLGGLNQDGWKQLLTHLQGTSLEAERLLDRFGHRLNPSHMELLLDIQNSIDSAQTFWRIFPEFAGVPHDRLPMTNTPAAELQADGYDMTAREIRSLLQSMQKLSSQLRLV